MRRWLSCLLALFSSPWFAWHGMPTQQCGGCVSIHSASMRKRKEAQQKERQSGAASFSFFSRACVLGSIASTFPRRHRDALPLRSVTIPHAIACFFCFRRGCCGHGGRCCGGGLLVHVHHHGGVLREGVHGLRPVCMGARPMRRRGPIVPVGPSQEWLPHGHVGKQPHRVALLVAVPAPSSSKQLLHGRHNVFNAFNALLFLAPVGKS
mmetsp:Transcript_14497/g.36695  ORF Transcript_14497/g.36695 Transcript_14497/m.36695 type:complete len:208 (-) Transcript_14497:186-809(-)